MPMMNLSYWFTYLLNLDLLFASHICGSVYKSKTSLSIYYITNKYSYLFATHTVKRNNSDFFFLLYIYLYYVKPPYSPSKCYISL